jgi:hypothetical protein
MFPPVVRFDMGIHLCRHGLAGWNWFHSNLFLSRDHRVEGGLWGWNGILIADWSGGGHHSAWLPDHAVVRVRRLSAMTDCRYSGYVVIRFRLADVGDLPTCGGRRRAKGEKASPLAIPGPGLCRLPGRPRAAGCPPPAGSHTPSMA